MRRRLRPARRMLLDGVRARVRRARSTHGWGMTEMSPVGDLQRPEAGRAACPSASRAAAAGSSRAGLLRRRPPDRRRRGARAALGRRRRSATSWCAGHWVLPPATSERDRRTPPMPRAGSATGDIAHDRPGRLPPDHRPRQGPDQVRRRVDQLDRSSRTSPSGPSGRGRGRGHRRPAPALGRAAAAARRRQARPQPSTRRPCWPRSPARSPKWWVPDEVAGRGRAAAHRDRQAAQDGAARSSTATTICAPWRRTDGRRLCAQDAVRVVCDPCHCRADSASARSDCGGCGAECP